MKVGECKKCVYYQRRIWSKRYEPSNYLQQFNKAIFPATVYFGEMVAHSKKRGNSYEIKHRG